MTAPTPPPAKHPVWARLLAALGVVLVGFPAATLISLTLPLGVDPVGLPLLACGIIGLASTVLLYRVARGNVLRRRTVIVMAAGVVVTLGGVGTAYWMLQRSFERKYLTSMKSELRTVAAEQETFFEKHRTFTSDTALLFQDRGYSSHVKVTIDHADSATWRASATYRPATRRTCRISGNSTGITDPVCE